MELKDKVIVITGAGGGIGRALAQRFRQEGPKGLILADIDAAAVEKTAAEVNGLAVTVDVANEADIVNLVERAEAEVGPIDLFCSNAGIATSCDLATPNEDWQRIWEINVMSHVYGARAVVPRMIARGGGYLLNTSSAAGLLNQIGSASYGVTKHAAIGFGEWVALTHGHEGIKVSMLCPQAVRTAMTDNDGIGATAAAIDGMMEPEELADIVVEGLRAESFLILPHPEVLTYMQRKSSDYDRWISGMNRLQQKIRG
jgi:NAD(P)-dependent dehydrogenase (short-subunit alcohol dehydrogenase family)